jgi:Spy/CpxP family protein refolding chaperone
MNGSPFKLILLLLGIFVAGGVAGGFLTLQYAQGKVRERGAPEHWGMSRLKLLEKRLELTEAQKDKLKPIIKRDTEELARLRQAGFADARRILQRMDADIAAILTAEQKTKFEQLNAEARERMKRSMEQRRDRGEKRDGRPPGLPGEGKGDPTPPPAGEPKK